MFVTNNMRKVKMESEIIITQCEKSTMLHKKLVFMQFYKNMETENKH